MVGLRPRVVAGGNGRGHEGRTAGERTVSCLSLLSAEETTDEMGKAGSFSPRARVTVWRTVMRSAQSHCYPYHNDEVLVPIGKTLDCTVCWLIGSTLSSANIGEKVWEDFDHLLFSSKLRLIE